MKVRAVGIIGITCGLVIFLSMQLIGGGEAATAFLPISTGSSSDVLEVPDAEHSPGLSEPESAMGQFFTTTSTLSSQITISDSLAMTQTKSSTSPRFSSQSASWSRTAESTATATPDPEADADGVDTDEITDDDTAETADLVAATATPSSRLFRPVVNMVDRTALLAAHADDAEAMTADEIENAGFQLRNFAGLLFADSGNVTNDADEASVPSDVGDASESRLRMPGDPTDFDATQAVAARASNQPVNPADLLNYEAFVTIRSEAESESTIFRLDVPEPWSDVAWDDWLLSNRAVGISVMASTDLDAFQTGWTVPGMYMGIFTERDLQPTPVELLNAVDAWAECEYSGRYPYGSNGYSGAYDIWLDCGDDDAMFLSLAAESEDEDDPLLMLQVKVLYDADVEAFEQILGSFVAAEAAPLTVAQVLGRAAAEREAVENALAAEDGPAALVSVSRLNLRAGPGTAYQRIGVVESDERLTVVGQSENCAWLQVRTPADVLGWISGGEQYVIRNVSCAELPEVAPTAPPPTPSAPETEPTEPVQVASVPIDEPEVDPDTPGCVVFQEQLGAEVTMTFTRQSDGWSETVLLPRRSEQVRCFEPGEYTYTFDAPPPFDSVNGRLTVEAGEQSAMPVIVQ